MSYCTHIPLLCKACACCISSQKSKLALVQARGSWSLYQSTCEHILSDGQSAQRPLTERIDGEQPFKMIFEWLLANRSMHGTMLQGCCHKSKSGLSTISRTANNEHSLSLNPGFLVGEAIVWCLVPFHHFHHIVFEQVGNIGVELQGHNDHL